MILEELISKYLDTHYQTTCHQQYQLYSTITYYTEHSNTKQHCKYDQKLPINVHIMRTVQACALFTDVQFFRLVLSALISF